MLTRTKLPITVSNYSPYEKRNQLKLIVTKL